MRLRKFCPVFALGTVLLFFGAASAQTIPPEFKAPVNLGSPINTSAVESDPFLTADGQKLFFTRDGDIWYANRSGNSWVNAVKLNSQVNFPPSGVQSPSVSPDGQKLYFVVGARDGFFWDVWVSTWNSSTNDWGTPVNIGWPVNTPGAEFSVKLSPDGQRIYFSSNTSIPGTRCGFYVSQWTGSSWAIPQAVLIPGGECGLIEYPTITADGQWIYFDQFASGGKSSFVSHWNGSAWEQAAELRPQVGGRSATPYITPSGDSLFLEGGPELGGGNGDIFLMERVVPQKIPTLNGKLLFLLTILFAISGAMGLWKNVGNIRAKRV